MNVGRIAVLDDDSDLRMLYTQVLEEAGYSADAFDRGDAFLEKVTSDPDGFDLVLSDFRLPGESGLDVFKRARQNGLRCAFLLMTAYGDFNDAIQALKSGVTDYLIKPIEPDILTQKVSSYIQRSSLEEEMLFARIGKNLVARNPTMIALLRKLARVADSKASILLTGESGTGKEVLARTLHEISGRSNGNFAAVNVSAIPETLFEGEFFGYKKGAFTDAVRDHEGYARAANGGTLFLDELGELKLSSQSKLLRLLEERKVQPLGSRESYNVDFRLISATNRDLKTMIRDREFREDLYYRIAVVSVEIPALRERPDDIIPLARHLLSEIARDEKKQVTDFTPQAQERMLAYSWPGNVRELKNRVYQAVLAADQSWIEERDLDLPGDGTGRKKEHPLDYESAMASYEKRYIVRLLRLTGGNINRVSEIAGISRKTIYGILKRHKITPRSFRQHYFK